MKKFFIKFLLVALVFTNATLVFAQDNKIDSIISRIETNSKLGAYEHAQIILDSLKQSNSYKEESLVFKIDLVQVDLYSTQYKDQEAIAILLIGLQNSESENYFGYASDYAFELGRYFSKANNYVKAFEYYGKSKEFSEKGSDSLRLSTSYLGIGSTHLKIYQKFSQGTLKMDSLVMQTHRDSSIFYHLKAINTFPKLEKDKTFLGALNRNLMIFYFYEEEFDVAEKYGQPALDIYKQRNDTLNISRTLNVMGAIKLLLLDYENSEKFYRQAFDLVKDKRDFESNKQRKSYLQNLSHIYGLQNQFEKAYNYRVRAYYLRDSIYEQSKDVEIAELESKYNLSEQEKKAEQEKNRRQRTELWLYIISVVSALVLSLLYVVFRSSRLKREKRVLVLKQEALLQERTLEKVQNKAQIEILNATIDGKETERRHIAEILHNSVSALLSSAGLHLQAAKISLKEKAPEEIGKSQAIVAEAGEKIRDLSHTLISSVLLKFGLAYAMDDLCEKYSNSKLTFESNSIDVQRFEGEFEIKIHSIIEELINNILKHSNAKNATILLKQFDGKLEIRIFDDGKGFDVEKIRVKKSSGLGLTQIEARIKMMVGVFDIKSSKETGTRIYINVPVPE